MFLSESDEHTLPLAQPPARLKTARCIGETTSLYLGEDVIRYVVKHAVTPGATTFLGATALGLQQRIKQQLCLLEIFRNVHILMHPKHLWMLAEWKVLKKQNKGIVTLLKYIIYINTFLIVLYMSLPWWIQCNPHSWIYVGQSIRRWVRRGSNMSQWHLCCRNRPRWSWGAACPSRLSHDHRSYTPPSDTS